MNRKKGAMLGITAAVVLALTGCGSGDRNLTEDPGAGGSESIYAGDIQPGGDSGDDTPAEEEASEIASICGYPPVEQDTDVTVEYEWEDVQIGLALPEDWEYEIEEYTEEYGRFGIRFRPKDKKGSVGFYFYDIFGVCGTGLEEQNITFDSGLEGRMGTYDGRDIWSFIVFPERAASGTYVAMTEGMIDWWPEYEDAVMDILDTAHTWDGRDGG